MSNLNELASRLARRVYDSDFAVTILVEDDTGSTSVSAPILETPGRKVDSRSLLGVLGRVMSSAHAGSVISITLPDSGESFTMAASGGAFDDRPVAPGFVVPQNDTSPSNDMRLLEVGQRLPLATRALWIGAPGDLEVRTMGTQDVFQPAFPVQQQLLPIRVLELGPATTAAPIFALF